MIRSVSFILLYALVPVAHAQEKSKDEKAGSPSDIVKQWNAAAAKRDMKVLANLASKSTPKRALWLIEQHGFPHFQGETKIIHEEISGDRAVVIYRLENRGAVFTAEIRYGINLLVREEGQWKVTRHEGGLDLKPGKQPNP